MLKYVSLVVVLLFVFASAAIAASVVLNPSDDAGIVGYNPGNNYGDSSPMWVGRNYGGWLNSLIRFDLSSYSGAVVDDALLRLYVPSYGGNFPPSSIWIGTNDDSWDEGTVTWNNSPGTDDFFYVPDDPSIGDWWEIDVTDWVDDFVNGGHANYGFQIGTLDTDDDWFSIRTKEYSDSDFYPVLEMEYHYPAIQSTSLGSIKSLFE